MEKQIRAVFGTVEDAPTNSKRTYTLRLEVGPLTRPEAEELDSIIMAFRDRLAQTLEAEGGKINVQERGTYDAPLPLPEERLPCGHTAAEHEAMLSTPAGIMALLRSLAEAADTPEGRARMAQATLVEVPEFQQ